MASRKNLILAAARALLVLIAAAVGVLFLNAVLAARCFCAADLADAGMYQLMRVVVYGSSLSEEGETVSARLSILDSAGNDCAVIERSWNGSSLAVDFVCAEFSGRRFFFPLAVRASGALAVRGGVPRLESKSSLSHYYLEDGRCRLLGAGSSDSRRKALFQIADFVLNPLSLAFRFGVARQLSVSLAQCEGGASYGIFIEDGGRLSLRAL